MGKRGWIIVLMGGALFACSNLGCPPEVIEYVDICLPSNSTGVPGGTLAVRIYVPAPGGERYAAGAPVLVWGDGGYLAGGVLDELPEAADDFILVNFFYPGGGNPAMEHSDGVYDYRGPASIAALRDVVLYTAGLLNDDQGRTIDDVSPVTVLHDNIGLLGVSNGGNIVAAVAAEHGASLAGHLRYIVQWEPPVSSQIATRDLGRILYEPGQPRQGEFVNPRYGAYHPLVLPVDYADLTYDPAGTLYKVFHDGNSDGVYTTVPEPLTGVPTPDLDLNGTLELDEDFPLDAYTDGVKKVYSRPVTQALMDFTVFPGPWPADVATPAQAQAFWDLREAVRLYPAAVANIPDLEAMVLAGLRDHVQPAPNKSHIRQAFEGWLDEGVWTKLNPDSTYVIAADATLAGRGDLPDSVANTPPGVWANPEVYCMPEDVLSGTYQLAAIWQMADRVEGVVMPAPPGSELITYVDSGGDRIAVCVDVPVAARYTDGAPIVVEASTWFVPKQGFHRVNDTARIGAVTVSYMWPERVDPATGAVSEGVYDYGGPDSLAVLRDVIRFASGLDPNADGQFIDELVGLPLLMDNVGMFASSHAGVVATNVLAYHGADLPTVQYLIGRENPTRDEMYPLEIGHFDDLGNPVFNPYYDESDYHATTVTVDYTSVGWYTGDAHPDRPYFAAYDGLPEHILHETICPRMWGIRYYSHAITQALLDNGALTLGTWPVDVANPIETGAAWPFRTTVDNYPAIGAALPDLKVMLVFAERDHVQAAVTKPHIRQAWNGFLSGAALPWVRMNPDRAYVESVDPVNGATAPDNAAGDEPLDWTDVPNWGFPNALVSRQDVWLASVAEMADRVHENDWSGDLGQVHYPVLVP